MNSIQNNSNEKFGVSSSDIIRTRFKCDRWRFRMLWNFMKTVTLIWLFFFSGGNIVQCKPKTTFNNEYTGNEEWMWDVCVCFLFLSIRIEWHVHLTCVFFFLLLLCFASLQYVNWFVIAVLPYKNTSSRETSSSAVIMQFVHLYAVNTLYVQCTLCYTTEYMQYTNSTLHARTHSHTVEHMIRNEISTYFFELSFPFYALPYLFTFISLSLFFHLLVRSFCTAFSHSHLKN